MNIKTIKNYNNYINSNIYLKRNIHEFDVNFVLIIINVQKLRSDVLELMV